MCLILGYLISLNSYFLIVFSSLRIGGFEVGVHRHEADVVPRNASDSNVKVNDLVIVILTS